MRKFKKLSTLALGFALAIGIGAGLGFNRVEGAKAAEEVITLQNIGEGVDEAANTTEKQKTISDFTLNYYKCRKQTNSTAHALLLEKGADPYISNHTIVPGEIKSVKLIIPIGASGKTTYFVRFGTAEFHSTGTGGTAINIGANSSHTFENDVSGAKYFSISIGNSNHGQVQHIEITYTTGGVEFGTLDHIELDHSSAKKAFFVGETFSSTGLVVTAVDEDDNEMVVSEFTTNLDDHEFVAADKGSENVVVTYQGKTADYNITVSEYVPGEGTVTLSVKNATYIDSTWTSADLNIVKSSPSVGDLTFSEINNIRLNALPNVGSISIGGNKTTGGSFKITLPALTYASAIKFDGLSVEEDATTPTLKINDKTSFTFASGMTSATLKPYDNVLVISTLGTSRIWTSSIEITLKTLESLPEDYATYFLDTTDAECALLDVKTTTWNSLQHVYGNLGASSKALLVVDSENETISAAMERYVFIATKYAYADFMNVGVTLPLNQFNEFYESNSVLILVVVASIFGITAIAGFYFISKRRKATE